MANYKIHPSIGIARLGNSPTDFYLSPEKPGDLPIECDRNGIAELTSDGTEKRITKFKDGKDGEGRVKRQAARFRIFVYDDQNPQGRELKIGDAIQSVNQRTGQTFKGPLTDIIWTVYLANKKAVWYRFQELEGEHGYAPDHPRRNADIVSDDARQRLIIDPGPQSVRYTRGKQSAEFAKGKNTNSPQTFPPPLQPNSIESLGEIITNQQDNHNRLIVLGGFGNSGSYRTEFGQPYTNSFVNNDGWFDDTSDGPVTATLVFQVETIDDKPPNPNIYTLPMESTVSVQDPAWVVVGYPRFAPQIVDIVTMDDLVYDLAVRKFAFDLNLYRVAPAHGSRKPPTTPQELLDWRKEATFNPDYYPYFWRDVWPIVSRPDQYQYVMSFDGFNGGDPHNTKARGNFDRSEISVPPYEGEPAQDRVRRRAMRQFLYKVLRQPGQENRFTLDYQTKDPKQLPYGMPLLCGDNPITNTLPSKFLCLTETMLFILRQWADGKFINEQTEHITAPTYGPGVELDRGVLGTMLGGSFCPGAETSWIMRNPAIYANAYRLNHSTTYTAGTLSQTGNFATGLEPGDITKYSGIPWQADFSECSTQLISVNYPGWCEIYPDSTGDPVKSDLQLTFWWPAHRPMEVFVQVGSEPDQTKQTPWSPTIPHTDLGDTQMVTEWKNLGFILNVPTANTKTNFIQVEPKIGPGQ
jgi:hypothetical protein